MRIAPDAEVDIPPARSCTGGSRNAGPRCEPLRALAGSSAAERFRSWTGQSGRRYVFSVYPLGAGRTAGETEPPVGDAVVIGVQREADGMRVARFVEDTGPWPDLFFGSARLAALAGRPDWELHLHLTAGDADERRRIARDLACCLTVRPGSSPRAHR